MGACAVTEVGILIIDDDVATQSALRHLLDSEGWKIRVVTQAQQGLAELAHGNWVLVIVDVAISGLAGPLFTILRELAQARPVEKGHTRARVLFLVRPLAASEALPALDRQHLPHVLKPFHLHDFLDKVGDLLMETRAITVPIRRIRQGAKPEPPGPRRQKRDPREKRMFASRDDYMMTEEEFAEFERQEAEERKRKKPQEKDLGRPKSS